MLFTDAVFVGVDPTAGQRPVLVAMLDKDLKLQALEALDMEGVLAFIAGLERPVVAITGPLGPNQGLLLRSEVRARFNLQPEGRTWGNWRVCEYELRARNIRLYNTPRRMEMAARWVRNSIMLARRLQGMGFAPYPGGGPAAERSLLEVQPHAAFTALLGRRPFGKHTLEGRMQRQLLLQRAGVDLPDPLETLERITPQHLLEGHLPMDPLMGAETLDALVAAYTAHLASAQPGSTCQVGEAEEGLITLPVAKLQSFYP